MSSRLHCPHCDSPHAHPMEDRLYQQERETTWYQCPDCRRMWSAPNPPSPQPSHDSDFTPES